MHKSQCAYESVGLSLSSGALPASLDTDAALLQCELHMQQQLSLKLTFDLKGVSSMGP
jgi:hypothetical protein